MDKETLLPLSGFRDLTDPRKYWVAQTLREVFESFGYQALETPALEKQDILLNKYGSEAQKLLYLFEDNGKRKVGLRYDLTLPLSRFVAGNLNSLPLPFKRYEIGPVWRAEKPQRGRYRQFTQADIDIVGDNGSLGSEMEIIELVNAATKNLGLEVEMLLNDRRIITEAFSELKIGEPLQRRLLQLLDKADKIKEVRLAKELQDLGLSDVAQKQVKGLFLGSSELEHFADLIGDELTEPISKLLKFAKKVGLKARFAPEMVRGLDYYTGTIFECKALNYDAGTVIAGGRYDDLVASLSNSDQRIASVGISFGVDRIIEAITEKTEGKLFIINLPEIEDELRRWAEKLRQGGVRVELYLDSSVEMGRQIKYAAKRGYDKIIIPLSESWKSGRVAVKNLETGNQEEIDRADFENGEKI